MSRCIVAKDLEKLSYLAGGQKKLLENSFVSLRYQEILGFDDDFDNYTEKLKRKENELITWVGINCSGKIYCSMLYGLGAFFFELKEDANKFESVWN